MWIVLASLMALLVCVLGLLSGLQSPPKWLQSLCRRFWLLGWPAAPQDPSKSVQ